MRFEEDDHKYFELMEHAVDTPDGVKARITRIAPTLGIDVTIIVPFTYRLPAETLDYRPMVVGNTTVLHQSFKERTEAEQWAIRFVSRLKRCEHVKERNKA